MKGIAVILSCFFLTPYVLRAQTRQLDFFVNQAIENSPLIKDYQNQVVSNSLDSLLLLAGQRPQVTFGSNDGYAPVINGYGYDKVITNGANLNGLLTVNKSLLNGPGNKVQFENIRLLSDAARNNVLISQLDLKKAITGQYITTYGDLVQVNFSSEIQDKLSAQETVLKKLTQKNVYRQADYLAFYVTMQQHNFTLKQQLIQYKNDYATLNYLAGITDTSQPMLDPPELVINLLQDVSNNPLFRKYQLDSLTLVNKKRLVDISYRPRLNVFADAGYNSSLSYLPYKNFGSSIGLALAIPIYDGRQKRLQYSKIAVSENTRLANRKFFINQYQQQITQLQRQLQAFAELTADITQQLKYIETLITINEKLLQTGDVRIYDYILALNNFLNARTMINDNNISRLQIINQINYWGR